MFRYQSAQNQGYRNRIINFNVGALSQYAYMTLLVDWKMSTST